MIYDFLFLGIPIVSLLLFIVSLCLYLYAVIKNSKKPHTFTSEQMKKRMIFFVVTSIIMAILVAVVIGFIAILYTAALSM